ncbi:MAG: Ni/Fe hydrogenase subunit alpha [Patescibacteria group bacterium]
MKIKIKHISRIEGHAGFIGHLLNGNVKKAKIEIEEGARLIEGILVGRHFSEAPIITARICGICPVIHNLTSIKAIENALNIKVRKDVILARKLMLAGQIIQSHTLHLFFLSLPDFLNYSTDLSQIKKYPLQTEEALEIREFANKIIETIGGRAIHPITTEIGGFKKYPTRVELKNLFQQANRILPKAVDLAIFFKNLKYPDFYRAANFVSLTNLSEYAFYEGKIKIQNSKSKIQGPEFFLKQIQEIQEGVVKRVKYDQQVYMLGALARLNNNADQLNKEAKKILKKLNKKRPINNIFYNIFAQAVEVVHFVAECQKLLKTLMRMRMNTNLRAKFKVKAGQGLAACEAPRGTLFHYYEINNKGLITKCNIITPTAQFLNNLEEDLKVWLPKVKKLSKRERERRIKMLIRTYDPCITCATH